jgi:hypothetical protein
MPEESSPVEKKRSRKIYVLWGIALTLLLVVGLFCWTVVMPVPGARAAVEEVHSKRRYKGKDQYEWPEGEVKKQIAGLGGPEKASRALGLYISVPLKGAKHKNSKHPKRKDTAFRMLTECGEPAWPVVCGVLGNRDPEMRILAACFLSDNTKAVGDAQPVLWTLLLNDPDEGVRGNAGGALVSLGGKAVPGLVDKLRTGNAKAQAHAIEILFTINDPLALARQKGLRDLLMKHFRKGKDEYNIAATFLLISIDPLILNQGIALWWNLRGMDLGPWDDTLNLPAPDWQRIPNRPPVFDDSPPTLMPSEQITVDYVKTYLALPDRPEEIRKAARWVLRKYTDAPRSGLPEGFARRFDRLFLSTEPVRYRDNVKLLAAVDVKRLNAAETGLLRSKLRSFLTSDQSTRKDAPGSDMPGRAPSLAFLRVKAVGLFGQVGTKEDVGFLRGLDAKASGYPPAAFTRVCKNAVTAIEGRDRSAPKK